MKISKIVTLAVAGVITLTTIFSTREVVHAEESADNMAISEMSRSIDEKISVKTENIHKNDDFTNVPLPQLSGVMTCSENDTGHNTAGTALYLDSSYMGMVLSDTANSCENWYFFYLESQSKISAVLEQPTNGDYDIYLYQYNDDGTLTLISYSIYTGTTTENLSAIGGSGYYFLRVVPETEANDMYNFMITLITQYDACEPDDIPAFAVEYENSINVNNTIDNSFDQDWSKLTITNAGTHIVSLSNICEGNTYNVYIYDSAFNFIAGMSCNENKVGTVSLATGDYYICVKSANGYSDSQSYNLKVIKQKSSLSNTMFTKTGQIVELTSSALYINGSVVDMNWNYCYAVNYTRRQSIITNANTSFAMGYLKNGTYNGPQSVSSSDCIAVYMDKFMYTYFCYMSGDGAGYDRLTQEFGDEEYVLFYVDAKTGTVIDTEVNYYYLALNMPQTFTEFN